MPLVRLQWLRQFLARMGLVVFGLGMALLVAEAALQLGTLVLRATGRDLPASWSTSHHRVLCLGDSNTYGLYLSRAQAYPQQLENLWNSQPSRPPIEVLNLGFPGMSSSRLRNQIIEMVRVFRPEVVTVMVGVNDYWTVPDRTDAPMENRSFDDALWRVSRVYRLLFMVRRAWRAPSLDIPRNPIPDPNPATARYGTAEFDLGFDKAQLGMRKAMEDLWRPALAANLTDIAAVARELGSEVIVLTYPGPRGPYAAASTVIRETAAADGVKLIDTAESFAPNCVPGPCPDLLFPDQHPTAKGHARIAEALGARLSQEAGW